MSQIDTNKVKPVTYIYLEGEPCKVKSVSRSKPGKHGSAKSRIMAVGIFDGRSRTEIRSSGHMKEL